MTLDQTIQFSGGRPINNLQANLSTRRGNTGVADLAKHEIVAALDAKYLTRPRQFLHLSTDMNPDATH